jgi:hypothetical protein
VAGSEWRSNTKWNWPSFRSAHCPGIGAGCRSGRNHRASGGRFEFQLPSVRNNSRSQPANAIYAEGGTSPLTVPTNTVRGFSGAGISFVSNQVGSILTNTIAGGATGIALNSAGAAVKVTSNNVNSGSGITLTSANSATVQSNTITGKTTALSRNESGGGGSNVVTKNTVNDANCGISDSNAASNDTFLPNILLNTVANTCP